jgi:hypothetical protein
MADHGAQDYTHGEMTIEEHRRTYAGFITMSKWGSLYIAAAVLLFTLWFCTPVGFAGAVITVVILVAVATLLLGQKKNKA